MNNKIRNIIIILVLIILVLLITVFCTDMYMMKQGKKVIFSTWGRKYAPREEDIPEDISNNLTDENNKYVPIENLSKDYTYEEAIKDGCFTIGYGMLYNKEQSDFFIKMINLEKNSELRVVQNTIEGDLILTDIKYDGNKFIVLNDSSRDRFASEENKKILVNEYSKDEYTLIVENYVPEENKDVHYEKVYLVNKNNAEEKILLYSYNSNLENKNVYEMPSFFGVITESDTNKILVKVDENEIEKLASDLVYIELGKNNDAIYEVGTRVKITHTGMIRESYPAQIDAINIEIKSCEEFELKFEQRKDLGLDKIIDKNNTELYDYDVYTYGGDVSIIIDGQEYDFKEALEKKKIRVEEIIQKANKDLTDNKITGDQFSDGGSAIYEYRKQDEMNKNYNILKMHTINGNRDVYIGNTQMKMNSVIK